MNQLMLILSTLLFAYVLDWGWRFWERNRVAKDKQDAEAVLKSHGMEVYTYLPSFSAENQELRNALSKLDFTNKIVIDSHGNIVGRLLPRAGTPTKGLRLVVDNTK